MSLLVTTERGQWLNCWSGCVYHCHPKALSITHRKSVYKHKGIENCGGTEATLSVRLQVLYAFRPTTPHALYLTTPLKSTVYPTRCQKNHA